MVILLGAGCNRIILIISRIVCNKIKIYNKIKCHLFSTIFVSNIAEAIATKPDVTGKPLFFYNKADEEIYVKQYDSTGSAPVKTYKLAIDTNEPQNNPIVDGIKVLDDKLNDIKKLLTPEIIEEPEKKGRK